MSDELTQTPYINLSYLELMADGDQDMKKTMIGMLLEEPLRDIEKMQEMTDVMNFDQIQAISHKMKSTLAFVGNEKLTALNKAVETKAQSESDINAIKEDLKAIRALYDHAIVELRLEFQKL